VLLRAGQTPQEPRLTPRPAGTQTEVEPHAVDLVGSREESIPPDTWTESGRTPALPESSSSRQTAPREARAFNSAHATER